MVVESTNGRSAKLNISADDLIKATAGRVARVSVLTAGSAAGAIHDAAAIGDAAAANKVATIPNTVGLYLIDFPCANGIVYKLGTGQVISVSYT